MSYFFFRVAVPLMHGGSGGRGFCVTFREGIWDLLFGIWCGAENGGFGTDFFLVLFFRLFILGLFSFWRGEGGKERRGEEEEFVGR